jgi:DNA-binding NarL/FixJ family response regulator
VLARAILANWTGRVSPIESDIRRNCHLWTTANIPELAKSVGGVTVVQISVLIVDDHPLFADTLRERLSVEPDLGPVSTAYSAADAAARLEHRPVDVAVLDFRLGDGTGTNLAARLRHIAPSTRIVMLSAADSDESIEPVIDALVAGARAWLPKTVDMEQVVRVIHSVHAGDAWLPPALLFKVISALVTRAFAPPPDPLAVLTPREREVLKCMADGLTRSEISTLLNMSGNTVRTHTQSLISKLGAHSSLEAVTMTLRSRRFPSYE